MANERVIAYTRVSSAEQAKGDKTSHEYQEQRIRLACEARGYKVVQVLNEVDKRWELDRPELTKARQALKNGEADVLMAMVMDRFSSDQKHLYLILDDVEKAGGRLEFADQTFEDTPEGRFLRSVATFMGELEVFRISARARQGHHGAALAGAPVGRRPYGYQIEGKGKSRHLVVDEAERSTVRRIFRDVADGIPVREIARSLEVEGRETSMEKTAWSTPAIRYIIHNAVYKGIWRGLKTRTSLEKVKGKTKSVTVKRPEEEQGPIFPCTPIVDADLWEAANARLKLNADKSARNNRHPETHLVRKPFGFCGECDHALHCEPVSSGRKARYKCGNTAKNACSRPSIRQEDLDAEVWERVTMLAYNPGASLKKLIDQAHDGTLDGRIAELETTVAKLAKQSAGLSKGIARTWANGNESLATDLEAEQKPITKALTEAEAELVALQEQAKRQVEFESLPARLEQMLKEDDDQFENMTWKQKRNLMGKLNLRVLLYEGKPDTGNKNKLWVHPPDGDVPEKPLSVADRTKITMVLLPEHLFGWDEDDSWPDFDPEYLIETAAGILTPVELLDAELSDVELSDEEKRQLVAALSKLTPEQLEANADAYNMTPKEYAAYIEEKYGSYIGENSASISSFPAWRLKTMAN